MAMPLRFTRFGRRPMWVSYQELIGEGDGEITTFPLPKGFGRHQHLAVYLGGAKINHDAKSPEHDPDTIDETGKIVQGKVKTTVEGDAKSVVYRKEGWSTTKSDDGSWLLVFDQPVPPMVPVSISRIFMTTTINDVATGKPIVDAPCFKFAVLGQTEMAALMVAQPAPEEDVAALASMTEEERKIEAENKAKAWMSASPAERMKQLAETSEKAARMNAAFLLWSDSIFKKAIVGWANLSATDEDGNEVQVKFTPENVDRFLGLDEGADPSLREGSLAVGLWVMARLQDVIAAQNARTGDLAGN